MNNYIYTHMNDIVLNLIIFLHILFIIFIIVVPFTNSTYLLFLHAIICPFIMIHWLLNDNTCALTMLEKYARQQISPNGEPIKDEDCFTCRVIDPVYKFTNTFADQATIAYVVVTVLWFISLYKLYLKYINGEINSFVDLARY